MEGEPLRILLVEDNVDHAELIMRGLRDNRVENTVNHVLDGETALNYIFRRGEYADSRRYPRPNLILLDLRLPKVDGLEVLKRIKKSEAVCRIPTVILTTSEAEKDIASAYGHHANSYLVKPVDFNKFNQLMKDLGFYWLAWNRKCESDLTRPIRH